MVEMVLTGDDHRANEIQEEPSSWRDGYLANSQTPLYNTSSQRGLLDADKQTNRYPHIVTSLPRRMRFTNFASRIGLSSPFSKFRRITEERDSISRSTPPLSNPSPKQFREPFIRKIDWASLWAFAKEWIKDPMNMALFLWITCVAISGAILFLVMTGMLDGPLPKKSQRNTWFEVNNQILNALFTLMCLYQHPKRFHHLILLCRWSPEDVLKLREVYCKNGTYKPKEWMHMMVVVVLLHVNCFAQYALCGLNLGYPRSRRPAIGVGICISIAFSAPAIASLYSILSPLGKDYDIEIDQEAPGQQAYVIEQNQIHFQLKSSGEDHRVAEVSPEWAGGLFDLWDDISLSYLSAFCSCCVFGWNMDRLGFGNMYVHIATFLLFCLAPFFIFNLAANNIDSETARQALGLTGLLLCIFGLLYGGFWRIQMRKRYNLPGNKFCFGKPAITDCFQWLCCCFCSLAQEVRTADYYDIVKHKFYLKQQDVETQCVLSPLPREDGSTKFQSGPRSLYEGHSSTPLFSMPSPSTGTDAFETHLVVEDSIMRERTQTMKPPIVSTIERGDTR